jgi:Mg2+ and Co2+ transporter CorA
MISRRTRDKLAKKTTLTDTGLQHGEPFMHWSDWVEVAKEGERRDLREQIYEIFSERLMIGLSLILIPVIIAPLLFRLPAPVIITFNTVDLVILFVFIIEYALKLALAEDKREFFFDPWHILDLFIILVPSVGLFAGVGYAQGRFLRMLRPLRLTRAASLGGRASNRRLSLASVNPEQSPPEGPLKARFMQLDKDGKESVSSNWMPADLHTLNRKDGEYDLWYDITSVSESDIPELSKLFGPASYLIKIKMNQRAYPQAERVGKLNIIFTKIPELTKDPLDDRKMYLNWNGLLYADDGRRVTTISRNEIPSMTRVPKVAHAEGFSLTPPIIAYTIMRDSLNVVESLIMAAEEELMALESLSLTKFPSRFLTAVFRMKKEIGIIISWLIHLKEVLNQIENQAVTLHGWGEEDDKRFKSLLDRCGYLYDAASNCNDNLADLIDFYINSTSFQMNRVMKVLAVMTALTIFPVVVGGLLGTNIIGNPWDITLAHLVTLVVFSMLATGWVYYKLGWLR